MNNKLLALVEKMTPNLYSPVETPVVDWDETPEAVGGDLGDSGFSPMYVEFEAIEDAVELGLIDEHGLTV